MAVFQTAGPGSTPGARSFTLTEAAQLFSGCRDHQFRERR